MLLGALIFGLGVYNHHKWPLVIGVLWLGFLIVIFPLIHFFFSMPLHYYNRLNQAKVWSRWDEVLFCVNRLQQMHRLTRIGAGEVELTRCRAQVLAAKGQLDEGLKLFAVFENGSKIPQWNYFSFAAGICDTAKAYRRALDYRLRAVEEKDDLSALWIDLAYGYVRGLDQPAEARKALEKLDTLEVSAMGVPYLSFVRGIICWREGKFAEARSFLEKAIPGLKPYSHNPLVEGLVFLNKSYLCATCGALGDLDTARGYFRETEKFLRAGKEQELLATCQNLLSVTS